MPNMADKYGAIMDFLMKSEEGESIYRALYRCAPDLFETPIASWDGFYREYESRRERAVKDSGMPKCPKAPPTPIYSFFSELAWFDGSMSQVAIVKNVRFCPPFWHTLEFVKLIFVISGSARIYVEKNQARLKAGDMCIVAPNTLNAVFSSGEDDIIINIIIRRSRLEDILNNLLAEQNDISNFFWKLLYSRKKSAVMLLYPKEQNDMRETVLDLCMEFYFHKPPGNLMCKSYLNLIFGKLLRYYECLEDKRCMRADMSNVSYIIKYMRENSAEITLPKLAKHFGFSESYTSRYIKKETGETFTSLLRSFRMQAGAVMLKNSDCSIEDIVEAVGYTDVSRFYRNFKQMYGMTPNSYRRSTD